MRGLLPVALGQRPGDLLLQNARIVNVYSGEVENGDVLVADSRIAAVGAVGGLGPAAESLDLAGAYLLPGLIDAHVHIESSHLHPAAFGAAALAWGTTAAVADPHEIANVLGMEGLCYMAQAANDTPLEIFFMAPSAVPATELETAAAAISAADIRHLLREVPGFYGLGEMMNAPGVLLGDEETWAKIAAATELGRPIDGHCPGLSGRELNGYLLAGISSEHEAATLAEAEEKLRRGLFLLIREGSAAKNLEALLPLVNDKNWHRFAFCADDINAHDLTRGGDMLPILKKAVALGLDPVRAVQMATLNPASHYGFGHLGAIAPGKQADFLLVENLRDFPLLAVYKAGQKVDAGKRTVTGAEAVGSLRIADVEGLAFPEPAGKRQVRVIRACADSLFTEEVQYRWEEAKRSPEIQKVLVLARHGKNDNHCFGLVEGFSLREGAIASTVAHDSHPLIVLGNEMAEMAHAARVLAAQGGGMVAVRRGEILANLPLPVAGLMTGGDPAETAARETALLRAAKALGCALPSPFMTLSFLALPVIPRLKITDRGLVDVEKFAFTSLFLD